MLPVSVVVDIEKKKQKGGFLVLWDGEIEGIGNLVHQGITILKKYENRWEFDEPELEFLTARILTSDTLLIGIPGVDYDVVMNADLFPMDSLSNATWNELNEYQNRVVPTMTKYKKIPMDWYILKIKPPKGWTGVQLSVREIYVNHENPKDDSTLELLNYPVESQHNVTGRNIHCFAQWTVVMSDTGAPDPQRRRGKPQTSAKMSKAAQNAQKYRDLYSQPSSSANSTGGRTTYTRRGNRVPSDDDESSTGMNDVA